jgi:hypothetical protein
MSSKLFTAAGGGLLALGLIFSAPPAKAAQPGAARPGDDQLTCAQLEAESAALQGELDGLMREVNEASNAQLRAVQAAQVAAAATGLAGQIPFIGGIVGQVSSLATSAAVASQQDRLLDLATRIGTRSNEIGPRLQQVATMQMERCSGGEAQAGR